MRNIKFRAWSKLHKKWYTNTILIAYDGLPFAHFVKVDDDGKAVEHQVFNAENLDLVVQQYTGVKDFSGIEIYEGDYVLYPDRETKTWVECEVKWKHCGLAAYYGDNDCNIVQLDNNKVMVVGNIFEYDDTLRPSGSRL